ncbi:hypothetical protein [Methanobacterium oryzae]|uniref:hypothetical protein n=1 Tax=Methanobacterium oryzae TaxID=69540 RepID=UPI003D246BB5
MQQNMIIGAIVLIALVVIGAFALTNSNNTQDTVTAAGDQATKLALYNNGSTWLHMDVVMENVTLKNGSVKTFYSELYIKPNGTITIDISNLAGYGNEKLPAGTTIRILAWKGLLNTTPNGTADLNLTMQGWSNTQLPGTDDKKLEIFFAGLPVNQLPENVTDNMIFTADDINKVHQLQGFIDDEENEPLYEEEILTVDQNGKVTLTIVTAPELCELIAHIL